MFLKLSCISYFVICILSCSSNPNPVTKTDSPEVKESVLQRPKSYNTDTSMLVINLTEKNIIVTHSGIQNVFTDFNQLDSLLSQYPNGTFQYRTVLLTDSTAYSKHRPTVKILLKNGISIVGS